jgi:hypothetical protein
MYSAWKSSGCRSIVRKIEECPSHDRQAGGAGLRKTVNWERPGTSHHMHPIHVDDNAGCHAALRDEAPYVLLENVVSAYIMANIPTALFDCHRKLLWGGVVGRWHCLEYLNYEARRRYSEV